MGLSVSQIIRMFLLNAIHGQRDNNLCNNPPCFQAKTGGVVVDAAENARIILEMDKIHLFDF
jgi:hypothetical protein